MRKSVLRPLYALALATTVLAATPTLSRANVNQDYEMWDQIFIDGKVPRALGGHLRLTLDLQSRRMNTPTIYTSTVPHTQVEQEPNTVVIIRPAVGYAVNSWATFYVGFAWQPDFFDSPDLRATKNIQEYRIWEQFTGNWTVGHWNFNARTRFEQRVRSDGPGARNNVPSEPPSSPANTNGQPIWAQRLRQQFRVAYWFRIGKPWQLIFWDEIFFHLNDTNFVTRTGLDQNRAFFGVGYQHSASARVEVGYMNQYVHRYALPGKYDPNQVNHILSINVIFGFGVGPRPPAPTPDATVAPPPELTPTAVPPPAPPPVTRTIPP